MVSGVGLEVVVRPNTSPETEAEPVAKVDGDGVILRVEVIAVGATEDLEGEGDGVFVGVGVGVLVGARVTMTVGVGVVSIVGVGVVVIVSVGVGVESGVGAMR